MIGAVQGLTFQHEPGRGVSGNGNLGLLVLAPSLLTFLILCIWTAPLSKWWLYDQRQRWGGREHVCVPLVTLLLCVCCQSFWSYVSSMTYACNSMDLRMIRIRQYTVLVG